ncbi:MAG: TolC family protein [Spirochaetales bacterium]|nr:TolC family protein [Spirochaetales bacterium]
MSRLNEAPPSGNPWNLSLAAEASLQLSSASIYAIGQSRLAWEAGEIDLAELEHRIFRDSRKSFLALLLLHDVITIHANMVDTAKARFERSQRRFELGDVRKVDMLSFHVDWQSSIPQLTEAQNSLSIGLLEFKRLLGLEDHQTILLMGEIQPEESELNAQNLVQAHLMNRYDIQSARLRIQQLKNQRALAISQVMTPTLSLRYGYTPIQNAPFSQDSGEWNDPQGALTLALSLPLDGFIPNTQKNLTVRNLSDEIASAQLLLADALQAGAIAIETVILNMENSSQTLRSLELQEELALESYDLVSRSYDVGEADYIQVQSAHDQLVGAQLLLAQERYNYASYQEDLNYALAFYNEEFGPVPSTSPTEEKDASQRDSTLNEPFKPQEQQTPTDSSKTHEGVNP